MKLSCGIGSGISHTDCKGISLLIFTFRMCFSVVLLVYSRSAEELCISNKPVLHECLPSGQEETTGGPFLSYIFLYLLTLSLIIISYSTASPWANAFSKFIYLQCKRQGQTPNILTYFSVLCYILRGTVHPLPARCLTIQKETKKYLRVRTNTVQGFSSWKPPRDLADPNIILFFVTFPGQPSETSKIIMAH